MIIQLKNVTINLDHVSNIIWKRDVEGNVVQAHVYFVTSSMQGTQQGMPDVLCITDDRENNVYEGAYQLWVYLEAFGRQK